MNEKNLWSPLRDRDEERLHRKGSANREMVSSLDHDVFRLYKYCKYCLFHCILELP